MHPQTRATLDHLEAVTWFLAVGVNSADVDTAIVLGSWEDAIRSCSTIDWENLCLEAANQYRERLSERDPARFNRWNDIVGLVKPASTDLVARKTAEVVRANNLPKVFIDTVQWDILHLCMETEYADVFPPGFYASQAFWYSRGHFPCGWEGDFPKGRLVIY